MSVLYFAYGSNMLTARMARRCPSARVFARAALPGYGIAFSKIGRDGTGKVTLVASAGGPNAQAANEVAASLAHGVIYELSAADIEILDKIEGRGRGYHRFEAVATILDGKQSEGVCANRIGVTTYIAEPGFLDTRLMPFDWYRDLVVAGAREHALPKPYRAMLEAQPITIDADLTRATRCEALDILAGLAAKLSGRG